MIGGAPGKIMGESKALEALFPGARHRILSTLFIQPDNWWSLPDLASRAGLQPSSLRQYLVPLRESGILRERQFDGHSVLQPDPASPVFAELQSIVTKLTPATEAAETILVVEDQRATAQITRILLERWGYRVLEAHSPSEAIEMFESHPEIRLLVSDVMMPEMTGPQLADVLLKRKPELHVVFMSGYPSDELHVHDAAFLSKPFNPASLARIIQAELNRKGVAPQ